MDEATLLERARSWDKAALAQVYDEYAPAIYRYAYRMVGHRETSQDVVSLTFHRFLRSLRNGGGPTDNLSAWLYRVAHNLVVDGYRREPEQPPLNLDDVSGPAGGPDYEARLVEDELRNRVRAALRRLTSLQQQVIALRFLEGLSNEKTAQVMGRSIGSVKLLQHRGLQSLRRFLEEEDEEC